MVAATSRICDLRTPVATVSAATGAWPEPARLRPTSLSMASLPVGHDAQAQTIIDLLAMARTAWMSLLSADCWW